MANSDFSQLTPRNKSALVTAIHKEITYYASTFCIRERVYVNRLAKKDGNIYWLTDGNKNLAAFAIMDENYKIKLGENDLHLIGHTISKRPGYMERILNHICKQNGNKNLLLICKSFVANSMDITNYGMKCLTPLEVKEKWPELANLKTDYFNVKNEVFVNGLMRKEHNVYIKLANNNSQLASQLGLNTAS